MDQVQPCGRGAALGSAVATQRMWVQNLLFAGEVSAHLCHVSLLAGELVALFDPIPVCQPAT